MSLFSTFFLLSSNGHSHWPSGNRQLWAAVVTAGSCGKQRIWAITSPNLNPHSLIHGGPRCLGGGIQIFIPLLTNPDGRRDAIAPASRPAWAPGGVHLVLQILYTWNVYRLLCLCVCIYPFYTFQCSDRISGILGNGLKKICLEARGTGGWVHCVYSIISKQIWQKGKDRLFFGSAPEGSALGTFYKSVILEVPLFK